MQPLFNFANKKTALAVEASGLLLRGPCSTGATLCTSY